MVKPMSRRLIILRHAHRDKSLGAEFDNGLSSKGKTQAKLLADFFVRRFSEGFKKGSVTLASSPRKRCQETLAPLAKKLGLETHIDMHLEEGAGLSTKVTAFLADFHENDSEVTVICSHGDWIPTFFERLMGFPIHLSKGAWAEVEFEGEAPQLEWLIQDLGI